MVDNQQSRLFLFQATRVWVTAELIEMFITMKQKNIMQVESIVYVYLKTLLNVL